MAGMMAAEENYWTDASVLRLYVKRDEVVESQVSKTARPGAPDRSFPYQRLALHPRWKMWATRRGTLRQAQGRLWGTRLSRPERSSIRLRAVGVREAGEHRVCPEFHLREKPALYFPVNVSHCL